MSDTGRSGDPSGGLFGEVVRGTVARVVFSDEESGWSVVRLDAEGGGEVTVVGNVAPAFEGQSLQVEGRWETDPRFGRQFRATRVTVSERPATAAGVERYLASGAVAGVGPELSRRIVERFGAEALEVIDDEPERLTEVSGIGPKRLEKIRDSWEAHAAERAALVFLQGHGLGAALARRVVRSLGDDAEEEVRRNPYRLAEEVSGVGFRTADGLARELGWEADAPPRVRAGLRHVLQQGLDDGHCFMPYEALVRSATELLQLEDDEIVRRMAAAQIEEGSLVAEPVDEEEIRRLSAEPPPDDTLPRAVFLPAVHGAEARVATRLAALGEEPPTIGLVGDTAESRRDEALRWVERQLGDPLGDDQRQALRAALEHVVLLVTGGPGTGKTTLIDAVVRCYGALEARVELAAPTGRAAKRLAEATGHPARTVHRLLEYAYDVGFTRGRRNPLEADVVVVDEASMVDLSLMDALVGAIPDGCRLILVGDADQLPPVGPGAVLRDLLEAGTLPVVQLREIFRQARRSLIVRNAHRINAGRLPLGVGGRVSRRVEGGDDSASGADRLAAGDDDLLEEDFFFVDQGDAARARELIVTLVTERIPRRFGLDPRRDVQVLSPMHRGECGVSRLNAELQERINPEGPGFQLGDRLLRRGDRVIQGRNDYDREVFNGDIGTVAEVEDEGLTVNFEGRRVEYSVEAVRDLSLAYAISVHKSQGSEYPAVIIALLPEHWVMLQRNLLYTAVTRAQRLAVLISTRRAVARAVRNDAPASRYTRLAWRLRTTMAA